VRSQGEPRLGAFVHDYLLHEFDHIAESLQQNEESGEKRVQFFIAVLTGVFGILGLAFKREQTEFVDAMAKAWLAIVVCLVVLFLFGMSTFLRLIERNLASDRYKFALRAIRRRFLSVDDAQRHPTAFFDPYTEMRPRSIWPVKGGWLDTVALLNSLIFGALTWVLGTRLISTDAATGFASVAVSVVVLYVHLSAARRKYRDEWARLTSSDRTTDQIAPRKSEIAPRTSD